MKYCSVCEKNVDAKRNIGIGSLIGIIVTMGFWLIAIPFYGKRCPLCKNSQLEAPKSDASLRAIRQQNAPQPQIIQSSFNPIEQIEKLAKLKESGAITEEEFKKQKEKLLG